MESSLDRRRVVKLRRTVEHDKQQGRVKNYDLVIITKA
jgi:hypothetical protein